MSTPCQAESPPPPVVVVAGAAGSGKSTLGRALATRLRLPVLDLDRLTNPLLDASTPPGDPHWLTGPRAAAVRAGRYAALRATAADILGVGVGVVLVAPFTAELAGGAEWSALRDDVAPSEPVVLYLDAPADVLRQRRAARGEARDAARTEVAARAPRIAHTALDAREPTGRQLARALAAIEAATGRGSAG